MARTRNIKPGFFTNDDLGDCRPLARLLYAGLWCHADREGRLEDRPKKLKVEILPWDDCDVDALLTELANAKQIIRYEVDGVRYIAIPTFGEHQNPHVKELPSTIPAPGKNRASTRQARKPAEATPRPAPVEPGLLPSSFPSPPSLPPSPPQAGGPDAPQGEGKSEAPSRANGTNPRSVAKAKREAEEAAALAEAKLKREAEEDDKWLPRLNEFGLTGKWLSAWGTAPNPNPNITEHGVHLPRRLWPALAEIRARSAARPVPAITLAAPLPAHTTDDPAAIAGLPDGAAAMAARYEELAQRRTG